MNGSIQLEYNDLTPLRGRRIDVNGFSARKTVIETTRYKDRTFALVKGRNPARWWVELDPTTGKWTPYVYAGWKDIDGIGVAHVNLETRLRTGEKGNLVSDTTTPLPGGAHLVVRRGYDEDGIWWDMAVYINGERRALVQRRYVDPFLDPDARGFCLGVFTEGRLDRSSTYKHESNARHAAMSFVGAA